MSTWKRVLKQRAKRRLEYYYVTRGAARVIANIVGTIRAGDITKLPRVTWVELPAGAVK